MNVFKVFFDSDFLVVEAESFSEAIAIWKKDLMEEWKRDGCYQESDEETQPESVELLSEKAVLRCKPTGEMN